QMLERTEPTALQEEILHLARSSGDALLAVVDDILDFSKIESGQVTMAQRPFELRRCVQEALEVVEVRAREKQLALYHAVDDNCPDTLIGDGGRLRQILINLLSNAVKFTEHGHVVLQVYAEPAGKNQIQLCCAITDTGIGIAAEDMDRLFVSFSQVDSAATRRHGGSGLGLAISKRLCELMGGIMSVASEPGVGSTFSFTVVAGLPESDQPEQNEQPVRALEAAPDGAPRAAPRRLRVLIVDDDATIRHLLSSFAEALGHQAHVAASGADALAALGQHRFDVALLDIHMPSMDGLSLAREVLSRWPREGRPYLIALTANALPEFRQACLDAGMDDFLSKPVTISTLQHVLEHSGLQPEPR
ncbi:MAG TPA: ATP-binding protein, partial [Roseiflexaceae bacterium]|nr:ATP-binding protein [Roseiflexaceae bacterium]